MADDKDLERQYRKNLMVVASIVLIYSIAGGKMAADLSMFGAKLQFSRPDWLEYAMVAVMCFFWWRHWQVSLDDRNRFLNAILSGVNLKWIDDRLLEPNNLHVELRDYIDQGNGLFIKLTRRGPEVIYRVHDEYGDVSQFTAAINGFQTQAMIYYQLTRSAIISIIVKPHFGDAILPSVTTMAALIAYGVQKLA